MYFLDPFSSIWCPDSCLTMLCSSRRVSKEWASPMAQQWFDPLGWEDPLEEGMATHSSILAWRLSRTEEPDGLQLIGLQRVGHNWSKLVCMHLVHSNALPQSLLVTRHWCYSIQKTIKYQSLIFWKSLQCQYVYPSKVGLFKKLCE